MDYVTTTELTQQNCVHIWCDIHVYCTFILQTEKMFSREQLGLQTQVLQTVMNDHHTREENAAAYDSCAKDYDKVSEERSPFWAPFANMVYTL